MARQKAVAVIGVFDRKGRMLWGKRRDNGKYTTPAGHLEGDESPYAGACRELHEESGLHPGEPLVKVSTARGGPGDELTIHTYTTQADGEPDSSGDPDAEVAKWEWIDVSRGLPKHVESNLHVPREKNHLLRRPLRHVPSPDGKALRGLAAREVA